MSLSWARSGVLVVSLVLLPGVIPGPGSPAASAEANGCLPPEIVGTATTPRGEGYWLAGADGEVFAYGDAKYFGSMEGRPLKQPVVGIVPTASGDGYWLAAADGAIFAFGDARAPAYNPLPATRLRKPVVGATRAGWGQGLWLTTADGGVFATGGARFLGSTAAKPLGKPTVDIVSTPSGDGYWTVAADGGVSAFGGAEPVAGGPPPGTRLRAPVVGATRVGATGGFLLTAADGGVFAVNGARLHGSAVRSATAEPVSGIAATPGGGYVLATRDGAVLAYGDAGFFGDAVGVPGTCMVPALPPAATGAVIVQYATDIKNGKAVGSWAGGLVPYVWGGGHKSAPGPSLGTCSGYSGSIRPCPANRTVGTDCSGFARWVYALAYGTDVFGGVNTNGQIARLRRFDIGQPGDLVFFGTKVSNTRHVAVFAGGNQVINALKTGTNIRVDNLTGMSGRLPGFYRLVT
ncbi:C40 family peptidase [Sphaerisporangium aureirubrum]|uniref:C40 family peptidase n=1 Tax=Sphaerisporangium aureirubrum TaxID=1544736 RepID=A0ABW1NI55_9ACTN